MKKLESLRAAFVAAVPRFAAEPERLLVSAEQGKIVFTASNDKSWLYEYRAKFFFIDFPLNEASEPPEALFLALLNWLRANNEWEVLQAYQAGKRDGIAFEVVLLDTDKADVEISIDLSERAKVVEADGGWNIEPIAEPKLADMLLEDWTGGPLASAVTEAGDQLLP